MVKTFTVSYSSDTEPEPNIVRPPPIRLGTQPKRVRTRRPVTGSDSSGPGSPPPPPSQPGPSGSQTRSTPPGNGG